MRAILLALFSAALFGACSPASKPLLATLSPFQLAGLLYLGAALAVAPGLVRARRLPVFSRLQPKNRWPLMAALLCGGVFGPVFLLISLQLASASAVSMWLTLEAVLTACLAAIFFREHLSLRGWLGVSGASAAAVILSFSGNSADPRAALFAGAACLCWAVDNNLTALIDSISPAEITFLKGIVCGAINLTIGLFLAPLAAPALVVAQSLMVGAFCNGFSLLFYIQAAQSMGASRSQLIFAGAPFWGVFLSAVFLHESLTALQAACALLFAGSLLLLFWRDNHGHEHSHHELEHLHEHRHDDGHHNHGHQGEPDRLRHSHSHEHEAITHTHPHWPDLHHRHEH